MCNEFRRCLLYLRSSLWPHACETVSWNLLEEGVTWSSDVLSFRAVVLRVAAFQLRRSMRPRIEVCCVRDTSTQI